MPNPLKGETPLRVADGREFTLVLDFEALIQAESVYGKPLGALMAEAGQGFIGASRALLYGALKTKHPAVSLRDAAEMLQTDGDVVSDALTAAADAAFPESEGKDAGNVRPAPSPPGKRSGRSGAKPA